MLYYWLLWKKNVDVTDKTMKSVSKVSTYRSPPSLGWLTECVYHRLLWICSTCHKHFPVLSSFMITGFVTRVTRCVPLFCWSLFFVWPLCSLFFDLRILITPLSLVSSNSSYHYYCSSSYWTLYNTSNNIGLDLQ